MGHSRCRCQDRPLKGFQLILQLSAGLHVSSLLILTSHIWGAMDTALSLTHRARAHEPPQQTHPRQGPRPREGKRMGAPKLQWRTTSV